LTYRGQRVSQGTIQPAAAFTRGISRVSSLMLILDALAILCERTGQNVQLLPDVSFDENQIDTLLLFAALYKSEGHIITQNFSGLCSSTVTGIDIQAIESAVHGKMPHTLRFLTDRISMLIGEQTIWLPQLNIELSSVVMECSEEELKNLEDNRASRVTWKPTQDCVLKQTLIRSDAVSN
jgi:hypothetical protein